MTPFFKKILIILAAFVVLLQADVDCRVLRAPKSSGKSPTLFGAAAGPVYVDGVQYPGLYGAVENPYYEAIHVPANTPTTIWTSQLDPVQAGGIAGANSLFIEYDRSDPLISIDAGQASGWIYRKVEGTIAGGAFCNDSNPSICATSTATTGIDYSTAGPGNGPQGIVSTCTAPFLWNGSNFVTVLTCPVAVFAQIGWVTGFGGKAPPAFDAGPGSPPTLTALAYPLIQGAAGGGAPVTLQGTNLTSATVTECGNIATGVSSTSTSVTYTHPANTSTQISCPIIVTTAHGFATISGGTGVSGDYVAPTAFANCWHADEHFSAGTWIDTIGNVTITNVATAPTLSAGWMNGQSAIFFNAGGPLQGGSFTVAQPDETDMVFQGLDVGTNQSIQDSTGSVNRQDIILTGATAGFSLYAGTSYTSGAAWSTGVAIGAYWNGGSSYFYDFTTAVQTAGPSGSNSLTGISLGGRHDSSIPLTGYYGLFCIETSPSGSPTSGGSAWFAAVEHQVYGL